MGKKWKSFKENVGLIARGYRLIVRESGGGLLACKALSALFNALYPFINLYLSARILDELAGGRDTGRLVFLAVLTVALNLICQVMKSALKRRAETLGGEFWTNLDMTYSKKILEMDYEDVEDTRVHDLLSRIKQARNFRSYGTVRLFHSLEDIVGAVVGIAASAALAASLFFLPVPDGRGMGWLSFAGGAVVLAAIVGTVLITRWTAKSSARIFSESIEKNSLVNRVFAFYHGALPGDHKAGKDVRLYGQSSLVVEEFRDAKESFLKLFERQGKQISRNTALETGCVYCMTGIIYLFVALKAWLGAFGVGGVVQYTGAVSQFAASFRNLTASLSELFTNNQTLKLTFDFLDLENKKYRGTIPTEKRDDNDYEIEFRHVSFRYPGTEEFALRDLNLKLRIGERMAVVGRNGSGKTTMIKLLCRLYDPTEGEILLNGIDIRKYDYDEYLALFSVVFQDFHLFSFELGQNVAASVEYEEGKARFALNEAGFGSRLRRLPQGLNTFLNKDFDESGVEISGGEAQKVAIARALYKNAPFLVLDEPTAALDPISEFEIYSKFNTLVKNRTAVFISHRLSSCRFCDNIAVFDHGRLVQQGRHDDLLNREGLYARLWQAQAQYYEEEEKKQAVAEML